MNPQRSAELEYWRNEFKRLSPLQVFLNLRQADLAGEAAHMPGIYQETGYGIDLGCGIVSVLEFLPNPVVKVLAVDPLLNQYDEIYKSVPPPFLSYRCLDAEDLEECASEFFDFAWCANVIDHTPNPERLLMEAHRVLKPGGRLYLLVNFDNALCPAHYRLWDMRTVEEMTRGFHLLRGTVYWWEEWKKYIWAATYRRP
jgi:SAM-dependent methyltransferase